MMPKQHDSVFEQAEARFDETASSPVSTRSWCPGQTTDSPWGQHGLMEKENLYDHRVRRPLLVPGPGVPAGERRSLLTCHCDIYPTLHNLTEFNVPGTVKGETLVPALGNEAATVHESLLLAYSDVQRAVREDRFKLIEYYVDGKRATQLFDLASDPAETTDITSDETHAHDRERLQQRLREWQVQIDDPMVDE